jgi:hypothetical protein
MTCSLECTQFDLAMELLIEKSYVRTNETRYSCIHQKSCGRFDILLDQRQ